MTITEVSCFEGTNMVGVYIGIGEVSCLSTLFKEGLLALRYTAGVVCLGEQFCFVVDEY